MNEAGQKFLRPPTNNWINDEEFKGNPYKKLVTCKLLAAEKLIVNKMEDNRIISVINISEKDTANGNKDNN